VRAHRHLEDHAFVDLVDGDCIECMGSPHAARLVTFGARDFHQILKAKFGLADR